MTRLVLILILCATGFGQAVAQPAPDDVERTVLVMLKMTPAHFRPGSGYGAGYGDAAGRTALTRIARGLAREHHLRFVSEWPMPTLAIDCFAMRIDDGRASDIVAAEIAHDKRVAWAQPMRTYRALGGQRDPLKPAQPAERMWDLTALHRVATGRGVIVAVIDSRIDATHPDLDGQVAASLDFIGDATRAPERHGTEVAGIIVAHGNNGVGIVGIAPAAHLLALRACREAAGMASAQCDTLSLAKALQYAIERRAPVINLSLTGPADELLARLIAVGVRSGTSVVAAADPARGDGGFPAALPGVIMVGDTALARMGAAAYAAPGRDIPTTEPGGKWRLVDGNSFAAAHVSGLMALSRERRGSGRIPIRAAGGTIDAWRTIGCDGHDAAPACPQRTALARSGR